MNKLSLKLYEQISKLDRISQ